MRYTQAQWLLVFFTYCFLGWVWEICYVSLKKREWVNRGFLHGPILPIYGFGAIIILWMTLPFRDSLPLIYMLGMFGATILEYLTGAVMEKLFNMRYWDYSYRTYNLNGYISLFTSLGWGFFSILLVKVIHPPIENLLLNVPYHMAELISLIFTVIFVADTTKSVQSALDMKELMKDLSKYNESFAILKSKLNAAAESISKGSEEFQERIAIHKQHKDTLKKSRQAFLMQKLQDFKDKRAHLFSLLMEKTDTVIQEIHIQAQSNISDSEKTRLLALLAELGEFKSRLKQARLNIASLRDKEYKAAANLIRRNPTSASKHFKEAFEEIKSLNERGKDKRENNKQ